MCCGAWKWAKSVRLWASRAPYTIPRVKASILPFFFDIIKATSSACWRQGSSVVEQRIHKPPVVGPIPTPATYLVLCQGFFQGNPNFCLYLSRSLYDWTALPVKVIVVSASIKNMWNIQEESHWLCPSLSRPGFWLISSNNLRSIVVLLIHLLSVR